MNKNMKSFKNIWNMAAILWIASAFCSCSEEEPVYTPAIPETNSAHITFAGSLDHSVEVEPGVSGFTLSLQRPESEKDRTEKVNLVVTLNEGNVFSLPASLDFAAGETEKPFTVSVSGAEEGTYYNLSVALAGDNLSDYTLGNRRKNVSFAIMKWDKIGKGLWIGNGVGAFFGVEQLPLAVEVEKTVTPTSIRFRFSNPYGVMPDNEEYPIDGEGKYSYYVGYPYNEAGDIVSPGGTFVIICDAKGKATLSPVDMGMDWGYGMFSTGSVSDKYGTYNAESGYVKFPPSSLYCGMADYGKRACGNPAWLYLSFDAFLNDQSR